MHFFKVFLSTSFQEEIITENKDNDNSSLEDNYNPYSEDFCYKDRLKQLNGNIYRLIQELEEQDKEGHRNAYIINEIEKYIPSTANIKATFSIISINVIIFVLYDLIFISFFTEKSFSVYASIFWHIFSIFS